MTRVAPETVARVAILGMGSVGAGWAALLLARGITVHAYDPGAAAEAKTQALITGAWPSIQALGFSQLDAPPLDNLAFHTDIAGTASGADVVIEAVLENLALKKQVISAAEVAGPHVPILSSAGGLPPSAMQADCQFPGRVLVAHPFNPSHLIPLIEVVPGAHTDADIVDWTCAFLRHLGKRPITIHAERAGHMVNRLQFALVREAIACLVDGVANAEDIDAAVRYGLAPRWLLQGGLHTVGMAGGPGGMGGILDHAGPAMQEWWTPSTDLSLDQATKAKLTEAATELNQGAGFEDWAAWRNSELVSVLNQQARSDATRPQKG
ncbi:MAG: 3-hydroxyacyl-CoA dehydrogenase NAD-binding domain-containing protein [Pseudomonadota bacterium]